MSFQDESPPGSSGLVVASCLPCCSTTTTWVQGLWTSCLVSVPKKSPSSGLENYSRVGLSSHVIKVKHFTAEGSLMPGIQCQQCENQFLLISLGCVTPSHHIYWVRNWSWWAWTPLWCGLSDYLTATVRLSGQVLSDVVIREPQRGLCKPLSCSRCTPLIFRSWHLQKFSNNSAVVRCAIGGQEGDFRK